MAEISTPKTEVGKTGTNIKRTYQKPSKQLLLTLIKTLSRGKIKFRLKNEEEEKNAREQNDKLKNNY